MPSLRTRLGKVFGVRAADPFLAAALASRYGSSWNTGSIQVNQDSALRLSTVWRCITLRANIVSSLPVDTYRRYQGLQLEVPKSPFFIEPDEGMSLPEWLYMSQTDLDRFGNAVGIITERDGYGLPRKVRLVSMAGVSMTVKGGQIAKYRIHGQDYRPDEIHHERGMRVPGRPDGLSPISYAAWTIGGYLSAQKFGNDYFAKGGAPTTILQNTATNAVAALSDEVKDRYRSAVSDRDIFVVGKDWTWTAPAASDAASAFLEDMKFEAADVCRFFGVPAEMVGAGVSGSAITYANITQLNLQFLVTEIGPLLARREAVLSRMLPEARFLKFNSDALLRMDPEAASRIVLAKVAGRVLAPSEARELDNLPPFTPDQLAEIELLLPAKIVQPKVDVIA